MEARRPRSSWGKALAAGPAKEMLCGTAVPGSFVSFASSGDACALTDRLPKCGLRGSEKGPEIGDGDGEGDGGICSVIGWPTLY